MSNLLLGDARDILPTLEAESCSLVVGDPPYDRKSLPLYQLLLKESYRLLKPGGHCLVILPHYAMPEIFRMETELRFKWLIAMKQAEGDYARIVSCNKTAQVTWKPIGWWLKPGGEKDYSQVQDSFENPPPEKKHHKWEQSLEWAYYCVGNFCPPGGRVLDPFAGANTVGVACQILGRDFIGIEIDPTTYAVAEERINSLQLYRLTAFDEKEENEK